MHGLGLEEGQRQCKQAERKKETREFQGSNGINNCNSNGIGNNEIPVSPHGNDRTHFHAGVHSKITGTCRHERVSSAVHLFAVGGGSEGSVLFRSTQVRSGVPKGRTVGRVRRSCARCIDNTNVNINVNTRRPVAVKQEADREDDSDGGVDGDGDDNSLSAIVADEAILGKLTHQSMGIKGILLDQKRAVCGVGNWVADEVLYQTKMHPDQNYLTREQAMVLVHRLHVILDVAVQCLSRDEEYPREWLFHYRWSKRGSKNTTIKDAEGRSIVFVTSGGRTSAVVPSIQKQKSQKPAKTSSSSSSSSRKQPRAKESAKKKKPTTINTTTSPLEASQRPPAIKSEENSKNTKKKTIIKTTPTIKKEKINDPREARNSGQKRKNAPGEAAVAIRRGTRRSPRFAKS